MLWGAAAIVALGIAPLWTAIKPARPVPEMVQSLWNADKITVVEVIDFDCPYCRPSHAAWRRAEGPGTGNRDAQEEERSQASGP